MEDNLSKFAISWKNSLRQSVQLLILKLDLRRAEEQGGTIKASRWRCALKLSK